MVVYSKNDLTAFRDPKTKPSSQVLSSSWSDEDYFDNQCVSPLETASHLGGPNRAPREIHRSSSQSSISIDVVACSSQGSVQSGSTNSQSSSFDSQSTIIVPHEMIELELEFLRRCAANRRRLKNELVPTLGEVRPFNDPDGELLKSFKIFEPILSEICIMWNCFAETKLFRVITKHGAASLDLTELPVGVRFIIQPIIEETCTCAIILDLERQEWGYIGVFHDESGFDEARAIISQHHDVLDPDGGIKINLTSRFHHDYPLVHLAFGIHYIARVFRYAVQLPRTVIYAEREFRYFCWNLCYEVQIANCEYNVRNELIDELGYVLPDAYVSYSYDVSFERSVVPSDQCPFCGKRAFNNLGSHISMAHGGQAKKANIIRNL